MALVGRQSSGRDGDRGSSDHSEGLADSVFSDDSAAGLAASRIAGSSEAADSSGAASASAAESVAVVAPPTTAAPRARSTGIWIDRAELMQRPTSGAEWEILSRHAALSTGTPDISDQNSHHDVHTLAAALVCVRVGRYCSEARRAVVRAIGTEEGGRWLAVGRNLGAYIIAADLLDLRADGVWQSDGTRVEEWIRGWLTKRLRDNNTPTSRPFGPFHSGANAAAQEGFAYAAVAAYLGDRGALRRAWDAYRTFVCDRNAPDREEIYLDRPVRDDWTHDDEIPCAVNPRGTTREVPRDARGAGTAHRVDGAIVADMRRGGTYRWPPGYTQYPWVGLEGLVPAAVILQRAGYPAFDVADRAVLRAVDYLWFLRTATGDERWFDGVRARQIVHLVNVFYGMSYPVEGATGRGRTVGYTGWTHPGPQL